MIALEKVEKKLETDSELLLIKAAEDAKNAHTYIQLKGTLWRNIRKNLQK